MDVVALDIELLSAAKVQIEFAELWIRVSCTAVLPTMQ